MTQALKSVALDLPNQRVVEVDALRTRSELHFFKKEAVQSRVQRLLTYYCKAQGISYKQGLNEVLAPFVATLRKRQQPMGEEEEEEEEEEEDEAEQESITLRCFEKFIQLFLRNMYTDEDFKAMQCAFHLFRLLLLYHCPLLCRRLDKSGFAPELYLTPWLLTVFARTLDLDTTLALWDQYLLEADPLLHFFGT